MTISMYQLSVPVFIRFLDNLDKILSKGEAFAGSRDINPGVLLESRLAPDMFPLSKQVQVTCDLARRFVERVAELEIMSIEDNEKDFAGLHERIKNTVDFLESIRPEQLNGSEGKNVTLDIRGYSFDFTGLNLLQYFTLPNIYFHVTTAYDILRHNGVELGKKDFIGKYPV